MLGRALGRVTAHELRHILLRTRKHSREGFAKPAQTSAELLTPRDSIDESVDSAVETGR